MHFYSASGSWTPYYCVGLLTADAKANLLDPTSWKKHPTPVFQQEPENEVLRPAAVLSSLHQMERNVICFIMPVRYRMMLRVQWTHVLPVYKNRLGQRWDARTGNTTKEGGEPMAKPSGSPII